QRARRVAPGPCRRARVPEVGRSGPGGAPSRVLAARTLVCDGVLPLRIGGADAVVPGSGSAVARGAGAAAGAPEGKPVRKAAARAGERDAAATLAPRAGGRASRPAPGCGGNRRDGPGGRGGR